MKYQNMLEKLLPAIGGKENIKEAYHCATRLRLKLYDETLVDEKTLKSLPEVLAVIQAAGQCQIVLGPKVAEVYEELQCILGNLPNNYNLEDYTIYKENRKKEKITSAFIDLISAVFTPILGLLTATGVIKGLVALLLATNILAAGSGTHLLLNIVSDCFFYFIPIFIGYTSMKKFGGTTFLGMAIGAALVYPSIAVIMSGKELYTIFSGTPFATKVYLEFLGIPILLMNYASSVVPVIITCFFAANIEKMLNKRISDLFKSFAVPAITLTVSVILGFAIIGPIATLLSNLLGLIFLTLFNFNATLSGFLYGLLIQACVIFGIHWGFVAISVNNLATLKYDPITIAGLASAFGQAGVVLVIMLKTRAKKMKSICAAAIISAMFGITEPCIYGVTLQLKKPFILASIASGIGGAIIGFAGVKQYFYGTNGVFGWLQVINPQTGFDRTVIATIIACIVSFVSAIILMLIFGKSVTDVDKQ